VDSIIPELAILHVCGRDMLRPLRDQILRISGFHVDSTLNIEEGLTLFGSRHYDLVLIDVEGESGVVKAEELCSKIKTTHPGQRVAFVCNWRVAIFSTCPDDILRTEFDPSAFVGGIREILNDQK
jgi:DNA-binding response OmpR family regulator